MKIWTAWSLLPIWGGGLLGISLWHPDGPIVPMIGLMAGLVTWLILWNELGCCLFGRTTVAEHSWPMLWELLGLGLATPGVMALFIWNANYLNLPGTITWDQYGDGLAIALPTLMLLAPFRREPVRRKATRVGAWTIYGLKSLVFALQTLLTWVFTVAMIVVVSFIVRIMVHYLRLENYPAAISLGILAICAGVLAYWLISTPHSQRPEQPTRSLT
ncbi:hypothetical protein [Tuwongella immobilis]|uniref:Uncharacterized protein n=1 Tax=Tuwongella immobilis TaxID=692036 RepID=A0A6C2YJ83_9BACT|nr:hypothetical protein [Tuwongella immobilis]VIP01341.1 unnamed protein product [Tuwongella immobilis]VTR98116.1 unnamed protein product [Tuwongella immobilis]